MMLAACGGGGGGGNGGDGANGTTFTINALGTPGQGGDISGIGTYDDGETATLTATPAAGHAFVEWTENGSTVSTNSSYTFTVTSDRNLVAHFDPFDYEISSVVSPGPAGFIIGNGTYSHGSSVTLSATPNTGYSFVNWTEGGDVVSSSSDYIFPATGDRSLVANFALNSYQISAIADPGNGGSITGTGTYDHGEIVTLTAQPAAGFEFINWTEGGGVVSTTASYSFSAAGNRTLVANFSDEPVQSSTVGGTVRIAQATLVDGDVNDPSAVLLPNNSFATAQQIPSPVTLGGYVNQPGSGAPGGRSTLSGDASDLYRATLAAGQTITLHIGNFTAGDLDLVLGDSDGDPVDSSEGVGETESLTVAASGEYLIEVFAFTGASNYVLTIGQGAGVTSTRSLSVTDDFVPGDVIVRFDEPEATTGGTATMSLRAQSTGLAVKAGGPGRPMLMEIGDGERHVQAMSALGAAKGEDHVPPKLTRNGEPGMQQKQDTVRALKALRKRADVVYAEPNYRRYPTAIPNDEFYSLQWHYPLINLPSAWDISTGSNVIVAVIDTGVLLSHPDLQGQLTAGYDFISSPDRARDGDGIDDNPDDLGNLLLGGVSIFHGTHVAATIAAATNNNAGVAGIAWDASIMPLRALGVEGGTSFDVLQAIRYAAGLSNVSGTVPASRADIINLSLAGPAFSQAEQDTFDEVRDQGVIVIAAASNNATDTPYYPASYDGVVSVSAVDINRNLASYSNFGDSIDVAAPGGNLITDINGDGFLDGVLSAGGDDSGGGIEFGYNFYEGTSMAAPHVAGVVSLMKAVEPALTPLQFDNLLAAGELTIDLGDSGRDDLYGHGLIDAHKAVIAAQGAGATPADPTLVANPGSLNFGSNATTAALSVSNGGGGTLTADPPTDNADWLTVTPVDVDGNNLGSYQVSIDRSGLAADTYVATITITSSENTVNIPVIMQVSGSAAVSDAGRHFIVAIDTATGVTVAQDVVEASNGVYLYDLSGLPNGNYRIFAGTDNNFDGFICDAGEACAAYPSLDQPTVVTVDGDRSDLDFSTGFAVSLSAQSTDSGERDAGYRRLRLKGTE